jgi:hypothetical protein
LPGYLPHDEIIDPFIVMPQQIADRSDFRPRLIRELAFEIVRYALACL